jgi:hypothetical protein
MVGAALAFAFRVFPQRLLQVARDADVIHNQIAGLSLKARFTRAIA